MLIDIWTIIWKEWQEILHQRGTICTTVLNQFFLVLLVSIALCLQAGHEWFQTASLQLWYLLPLLLVTTIIPDSFAGERERHTLATLLASRLSESAILLGKIGAAVSYACGLTLIASLLSMVIVNITNWDGVFHFYSISILGIGISIGLLTAMLIASIGVFFSLRAATVRQAQQSLGLAIFLLVTLPLIGLNVGLFLLPMDWRASLAITLNTVSLTHAIAIAALFLVGFDIILVLAALKRFKRTQLLLD